MNDILNYALIAFLGLIIAYMFIKLILRTYFNLKKEYTSGLTTQIKDLYNGKKDKEKQE